MNILSDLEHSFYEFLQQQFNYQQLLPISFDLITDEQKASFGDISSNAAMVLAKQIGLSPRIIADKIVAQFKHNAIQKIEVAGPGFLNITLNAHVYTTLAHDLFSDHDSFFRPEHLQSLSVSLEFVSANPTGPLHLGHGRGGIIGDVLGNIMRFLGHHVIKEFYINDAGSQIQKLGISFKARCLQQLGMVMHLPEDGYHGDYLVALAQECVAIYGTAITQKDDAFFAHYAKEHLLNNIKTTLEDYGIFFDVWFSEKTLHEDGSIVKALQLLEKNHYTYHQDNALWFRSTQFGDDKDRVLKKATGELTYVAADVAYLENKLERKFDKLIYILGQDHHSYVQRLKGLMQALGHKSKDLDVILYQLVTIKEGGQLLRMSKRAGTMVTLHEVIQLVGKDVARFFYLHRKADAHLDFDIDLALKKTEENPVYYVQYAYVRTRSILTKAAEEKRFSTITAEDLKEFNHDEQLLIKKIVTLKSLLLAISHNYQTHLLTYYIIELAHVFHSYYAKNKVMNINDIPTSRSRLALISLLSETFELCLTLLGISCPESM